MANKAHIFFSSDEATIMGMELAQLIEDLEKGSELPWNPESRKDHRNMLTAARSAAAKLEKFAGIKCELPPYIDGEEKDYLTKES